MTTYNDPPFLDVLVNLPFFGVLKYANHRNTQHGERLRVTLILEVSDGYDDENGAPLDGPVLLWLTMRNAERLIELGAIVEKPATDKGPQFGVQGKPKLRFLKTQEKNADTGKKYEVWTIERLDSYSEPVPKVEAPPTAEAPPSSPSSANGSLKTLPGRRVAVAAWLAAGEAYATACLLTERGLSETLDDFVEIPIADRADLIQRGAATLLREYGLPGFRRQKIGGEWTPGLFESVEKVLQGPIGDAKEPEPERPVNAPPAEPEDEDEDDDLPF